MYPASCVQVFISEQVLYSKADLMRHNQVGDVEGAMAESGFKGHPMCRSAPLLQRPSYAQKNCYA